MRDTKAGRHALKSHIWVRDEVAMYRHTESDRQSQARLGWAGLGWAGLSWAGLGFMELGRVP